MLQQEHLFSLVRRMGLEPTQYCYRQHLKLVRLPFRHPRTDTIFIISFRLEAVNSFSRNLHEKMLNSSNSEEMGYSAVIRLSGIIMAQENRHSISAKV